MRIISGEARGRSLRTVSARGLRPAMARTREALFSMLEARGLIWTECPVLDLFAGSGSLALECVSRGAPLAWLVDNSKEACDCIKANIASLGMEQLCRVFDMDVLRFLQRQNPLPFGLVFIDPPYRRNLASTTLRLLEKGAWLKPQAFVAAEVEKNLPLDPPSAFEPAAERNFGQTTLHIWKAI